MELLKKCVTFLHEALTEDGKGSCSRLMSFAMVMSAIVWVTYLILRTKVIPDMAGPTMWASGGALHYGVNKASEIAGAIRGTSPSASPSTSQSKP